MAQTAVKPRTRIVFLGTKGGPRVTTGASNPANLVMEIEMVPPTDMDPFEALQRSLEFVRSLPDPKAEA